MYDYLFDALFPIGFGKPKNVIFNTNNIKDMNPAIWEETEYGYIATVKTLGIEKADVSVKDSFIKVSGKNTLNGRNYDTTIDLPVAKDVLNNISEIKYRTECGLTFIQVILNRPSKKEIKISEY